MRKEYNKIKNFSKVCSLWHPTISLCWNIDEFSEKTTTNLNGNLIFEQANLILITPTGSEQNVNFCTWLVNIYSYYLLSIKKMKSSPHSMFMFDPHLLTKAKNVIKKLRIVWRIIKWMLLLLIKHNYFRWQCFSTYNGIYNILYTK